MTIAACSSPRSRQRLPRRSPRRPARCGRPQAGRVGQGIDEIHDRSVADNIFNAVGTTSPSRASSRSNRRPKRTGTRSRRRDLARRRRLSAQGPPAVHAAGRREQQHGTGRGRTVAGADHGEGRARSGGVERAHRGAEKCRARSARCREAKDVAELGTSARISTTRAKPVTAATGIRAKAPSSIRSSNAGSTSFASSRRAARRAHAAAAMRAGDDGRIGDRGCRAITA